MDSSATGKDQVLDAFEGSIQPVKRPITYHLAELLVAIVMIILPLIYLALIAVACWAVYYHAVNHTGIMEHGRGRGRIMAVLVYLAPIAIGGILVAFMFKPLFSRAESTERDWSLDPDSEPLVFAFVNRVCEIVHAPKPKRIDIDTNVNASAAFRRGFLSMFGNDLVLTIGLPLVAGLNLRQFAGVLAHEFGHFSQGAGMRLTYIIRTISHWFARVVYERDAWDEWLDATAKTIDFRIGWILHLSRLFVWLTRKILWGLMTVGNFVAGHMLRQMEFDADRYEARLAGSDSFESTMRAVTTLGFAQQGAMADLRQFYSEGRLSDDFAELVVIREGKFRPEQLAKINERIETDETGWLDTHPADKDRIKNAHAEASKGVFHLEIPATSIFKDFETTSKDYTARFYSEVFGDEFSPDSVFSNESLLEWQRALEGAFDAQNRVFQGAFPSFSALKVPTFRSAGDVELSRAKTEIVKSRKAQVSLIRDYEKASEEFERHFENRIQVDQAEMLCEANLAFEEDDFFMPLNDMEKVTAAKKLMGESMAAAAEKMQPYEDAVARRLALGLGLAQAGRVPLDDFTSKIVARIDELRGVLAKLDQHMPLINEVRHTTVRLTTVFSLLQSNDGDESIVAMLHSNNQRAIAMNAKAYDVFDQIDYPFDHADAGISVARFCVPKLETEHAGQVYDAGENLYLQVPRVRARIFGMFCQVIEAVEEQLGLESFPDVESNSDDDSE